MHGCRQASAAPAAGGLRGLPAASAGLWLQRYSAYIVTSKPKRSSTNVGLIHMTGCPPEQSSIQDSPAESQAAAAEIHPVPGPEALRVAVFRVG